MISISGGKWRSKAMCGGVLLVTLYIRGYLDITLFSWLLHEYWEIRTDFTTLLLHNYKSKSDCEDYK
jgi:hypothetical protein